jgi:hypothetical protein
MFAGIRSHPIRALIALLPTNEGGAMTINSPESLPDDDEPQGAAVNDMAGSGAAGKDDDGVPTGADGVGLGLTHEPNTFEPEEDPEAD